MKQIFQNLSNGDTEIQNVPCPQPKYGEVLIATSKTLVSSGTERMLMDFGKSGLVKKALSQPDRVKQVLEKAKTDGLAATFEAVKSKLDQPLPLGYCNVGTVISGEGTDFTPGDRVISNGSHAEVVRVPKNLVSKIPNEVDDETAAFTVLSSIALQGIRLLKPTIGERVVVVGLGLIGLVAVQILKSNGCRVLGIDIDSHKCEVAKIYGAEIVDISKGQDVISLADGFSRGRGVDAVLITASSKSSELIHQAATMCRKRGRIVLVGVVGLNFSRDDFYEKELTFQVSCSYGPGRYDDSYERKGNDYPIGFVRWTENRNFEAILDLMVSGSINVSELITDRFDVADVTSAYKQLHDPSSLGILLNFREIDTNRCLESTIELNKTVKVRGGIKSTVSFIGGGNYASRVLMPAFKKAGAKFDTLVTDSGLTAAHQGRKNDFTSASTKIEAALTKATDAVVIATRHNLHSAQVLEALNKGKHVFVEKPLALNNTEIQNIEDSLKASAGILMVGYNRRFSPLILKMKELLRVKLAPKTCIITMSAGEIPKADWTQDIHIGGGRIIGEACHCIDLMRFLVGAEIKSFHAQKMGANEFVDVTEDKAIITLTFEDGSIGSIHYFANGGKSFPKERIEVFCDNGVLQLDNFRSLHGFGWKGFKNMKLWQQNKGQLACVKEFMNCVRSGGASPIPPNEIFEVARVSVEIAETLRR